MKKAALWFTFFLTFLLHGLAAANEIASSEQVFKLSATALADQGGIQLNWHIADNAYLYKRFIKVISLEPKKVQVGTPVFPKGETKETVLFGKVTIYRNDLNVNVPIENSTKQPSVKLKLIYQGCSDDGQCFPPITQKVTVNLLNTKSITDDQSAFSENSNYTDSETQTIAQELKNHSFWKIILLFLGLGFFLSLTPCILPMIPILSSIILQKHIKHHKNTPSRLQAFVLSLAYVFGIAVAYALLGFLMSFIGAGVQAIFQNPYVIVFFGFVFVLLALSVFGFFEIKVLRSSSNKLAEWSQKLAGMAGKNYFTVAAMGFLSALIVSPCVTPPLAGALAYMAATGDVVIGTIALFFMGFGMGIPLIFIEVLSSKVLPKAGSWMDIIRFILGLMLLGMAVILWQRVISVDTMPLLWGGFFILISLLLFWRIRLKTRFMRILFQTICFIGVLYGALPIVEYFSGHVFLSAPKVNLDEEKVYISVKNNQQLDKYLTMAKKEHKPVMIDFYADWCLDCQSLEATVLNQPKILKELKKFVWIKVDMTSDTQAIWALQEKYHIAGPPTFLFYSANGQPLKSFNFVGLKSKKAFLHILKEVQSHNHDIS